MTRSEKAASLYNTEGLDLAQNSGSWRRLQHRLTFTRSRSCQLTRWRRISLVFTTAKKLIIPIPVQGTT
ncbi:hypothetical protein BJV78DRAFT_1246013 [Lactifluus subvellereus]|nr:hypothetical protein BJV78DRAFT_1246013 [Lactifluus subvellereus]